MKSLKSILAGTYSMKLKRVIEVNSVSNYYRHDGFTRSSTPFTRSVAALVQK